MNGAVDGSIDSGMQISSGKSANVRLVCSDADLESEWYALLRAMGYAVLRDAVPQRSDAAKDTTPIDLILLLSPTDEAATVDLITQTTQGEQTPPVVVFGKPSGVKWPKRAIQAGAFGYLPMDAKLEQQAGLLAAAVRFREMQKQVQLLVNESERLCGELVGSYGQTSEKLAGTMEEVQKAKQALQDVQAKIIKAFT
jgi:DNA-binding NtrC family response regulator